MDANLMDRLVQLGRVASRMTGKFSTRGAALRAAAPRRGGDREVNAWQDYRNKTPRPTSKTADARVKLKRLYPSVCVTRATKTSSLRGLMPTKQCNGTRRRRNAYLKRPARRQRRDTSWRRLPR
jgi:hypothetical protein